jgi:hypothetical protein
VTRRRRVPWGTREVDPQSRKSPMQICMWSLTHDIEGSFEVCAAELEVDPAKIDDVERSRNGMYVAACKATRLLKNIATNPPESASERGSVASRGTRSDIDRHGTRAIGGTRPLPLLSRLNTHREGPARTVVDAKATAA